MSTKPTQIPTDREKDAFIKKLVEVIHKEDKKKKPDPKGGKPS